MATFAQGSEGKLLHLSSVTRLSVQVCLISRVNTNLSPLSNLLSSRPSIVAHELHHRSSNPMHKCGEENDLIN